MPLLLLLLLACNDDKSAEDANEPSDFDQDGEADTSDCAPADPARSHLLDEIPYDGADNDCDPDTPDNDRDSDGFLVQIDCDDDNDQVYPGQDEVCDGIDNDCDDEVDGSSASDATTVYLDGDGDGYGDLADIYIGCEPPATGLAQGGDCDDNDDDVHPGVAEVCGDGDDNDCDGGGGDCAFEGAITAYDAADATLYGSAYQELCGQSLGNAGDLDDDGLDEILVGCPSSRVFYDDGVTVRSSQGKVWLAEGPFSGDMDLGSSEASFHVDDDGSLLGWHLGPAPDLDGDGYAGVWMGAAGAGEGGAIYVFEAPLSGAYTDTDAAATVAGFSDGDRTGLSDVAWVGDQDGDGEDDLLVGSGDNVHARDDVHAWLMSGPITGDLSVEDATATFAVDTGSDLAAHSWFQDGTHVSTVDLNDDGVGDYLFASPMADLGGVDSGGIYLVLGPLSGTFDLRDGDADGAWAGEASGDWAGYRGASSSDLDGDGRADLLITAPGADGSAADQGRVYIAYTPAWSTPYTRDLGAVEVKMERDGFTYGWSGWSSTITEDVTGDGESDLLLAGHAYGETVWLVEGPPEDGTYELNDAATAIFYGGYQQFVGDSVLGADTDGDGRADILTGGAYNKSPDHLDAGSVFVLLGRMGI